MTQAKKRNGRAGVTLLEMMIVLAIMALVMGLAAPRLMATFGRAKSQSAEIQLSQIGAALNLFYVDTGRYPTEAEGLAALLSAPTGLERWNGPYLDGRKDTADPWGRDYEYRFPVEDAPFGLMTYGRDGIAGGTSEDRDLNF
jgi:general secretion pathway protein G